MNSRRGTVDLVGRWDAVATIELLEGPAFATSSASSAPPLFPKRRQSSWWQVTAECQMKRAHAGKRVNLEALAKIVIDGHDVQSIAGVTLTCPGTMESFFMRRLRLLIPLGHGMMTGASVAGGRQHNVARPSPRSGVRCGRPFLQRATVLTPGVREWVGGHVDGLSNMSDRLLTSTAAANQTTVTGLHRRTVIAIHGGNVAFVSTEQADGRHRMSTNGWTKGVLSGQAAYGNITPSSFFCHDYDKAARRAVLVNNSSSSSSHGRKWLVGWPPGRWWHAQRPKYEVGGLPAFQPSTPRRKGKTDVGVGRTELNPDLAATVVP